LEEILFEFDENLVLQDAGIFPSDVKFGIGDNTLGPEPGPEMPKKRRPQIL
jgi:hypothetical protein